MSKLTLFEGSVPGTPNTNGITLYAKSNKKLAYKADDGVEQEIGGTSSGVGDIDIDLTGQVAYDITNSMSVAYTAPSTAGFSYVIKSIHITNISSSSQTVSGRININGGGAFSIGNNIPVPEGSAVELFVRVNVLTPDDSIELQASSGSALQAWISIAQYSTPDMVVAGVSPSDNTIHDLYTSTSNPTAIESVLLANDSSGAEKATVMWTNGSNTVQAYLCYNLAIGNNSTVELLQGPKRIPAGHKIRVQLSFGNTVDTLLSGQQIV